MNIKLSLCAVVLAVCGVATTASAQLPLLPLQPGMSVATCRNDPENGNFVLGIIDNRDPECNGPGQVGPTVEASDNWVAPMYHGEAGGAGNVWTAANLGQVFGIALDNAANPNIYVSATSVFGVFGSGSNGSIFRIDGTTGAISLFASLPNSGSGLGNIAYDRANAQFFVTNFEDGKIYRLSAAGATLQTFDPFAADNGVAGPASLTERIFGVQVHGCHLYFGTWSENQNAPGTANRVYSLELGAAGEMTGTEQLEVTLPRFRPTAPTNPIADIAFSGDGRMMIAERTMFSSGSTTQTLAHQSRALEFVGMRGAWVPSTNIFEVGAPGFQGRGAAGGTDYDCSVDDACNDGPHALFTADAILFESSPRVEAYGLQFMSADGGDAASSYVVDFDGDVISGQDKTEQGDIEAVRGCFSTPRECDPGCRSNADCAGTPNTPICDVPSGTCVECTGNGDCNDGNDCTADSCVANSCGTSILTAGTACAGGVCDGNAPVPMCITCLDDRTGAATDSGCNAGTPLCDDSGPGANVCVTCIDNVVGAGTDLGCNGATPFCDDSGAVPVCVACATDSDCNDGNECTNDSCVAGSCQTTNRAGQGCSGGVCDSSNPSMCVRCVDDMAAGNVDSGCSNGAPNCDTSGAAPVCVGCATGAECADGNDCTDDVCSGGTCSNPAVAAGSSCAGGVCNGAPAMCVNCRDTVAGSGTDQGCNAANPICDESGPVPVCVSCATDADCSDGNDCTLDNCVAGTCSTPSLPQGTPCAGGVCDGAAANPMCEPCLDTMAGSGQDAGCAGATPLCNTAPSPNMCVECITTADCSGSSQCVANSCTTLEIEITNPDAGTTLTSTSTTPAGTSSGLPNGTVVNVTINGPGGPFNCSGVVMAGMWSCSTAITGLTPGEDYTTTANASVSGSGVSDMEPFDVAPCSGRNEGDVCADNRGAASVRGVCDADGGSASCVPCVDDVTGSLADSGCTNSAPLCTDIGGTPTCTICADDTTGMTDIGCDMSPVGPVCNTTGMTNVCNTCEDSTSAAGATDNGCSDSLPICLEGGAGPRCVQCDVDGDCDSGFVCNSSNTCQPPAGCTTNADCGGSTPVCNTASGDCVQCLMDSDCSGGATCMSNICGGGLDSDMDGVPDATDIDDDNDGILDVVEQGGDADMDGVPDYWDPDQSGCTDANGDGMCETPVAANDWDGDGIPNRLDLDSDDDGIPDVTEAGGADTDDDGRIDGFVDGNGNGWSDPIEAAPLPTPNTDDNGFADYLDLDSDDDGITDTQEAGAPDADGDGIPDVPQDDTNNNGIADAVEGAGALPVPDFDGDGTPDYQDLDSDNDVIPDANEAHDSDNDGTPNTVPVGADTDGDGIDDAFDPDQMGTIAALPNTDMTGGVDHLDTDADDDGVPDNIECAGGGNMCVDTDMDGTADYRDLDSDGDSLEDINEGHDTMGLGNPDVRPLGVDINANGLDDAFDPSCADADDCAGVIGTPAVQPDFDEDGLPNRVDVDDDNDSILTATEVVDAAEYVGPAADPTNIDGDMHPNWFDTDSDGDGVGDNTEETRPELDGDLDDNDILDYLDPLNAPDDSDGDTIIDIVECIGGDITTCQDSDGDGSLDYLDVDDDNDGILTRDEYNAPDFEDGDPANDHDADNDGVPNHLDLDSDNDGIPDLHENGNADLDADGDGMVDGPVVDGDMEGLLSVFDPNDADPDSFDVTPVNTDGLEGGNWVDLDADNDGIQDILEADGVDADNNGIADDLTDTDNDGLVDLTDGTPWPTPDTDGDGMHDYVDTDSDNDTSPDITEGHDVNADGAGDVSPSGLDANNNGWDDAFEDGPTLPDFDGDGMRDWRDTDDDNDGLLTIHEDVVVIDNDPRNDDTDNNGHPNYLDIDDDGDSIHTVYEQPDNDGNGSPDDAVDFDGDMIPDYLDVDDDNDTVNTIFENPDPNGDGNPDDAQNTDGDDLFDYLDIDDDDDGILTIDEMPDPNGDNDPADAIDTDEDTIPDYLDNDGSRPTFGGVAGGALNCAAVTSTGTSGTTGFVVLGLGAFLFWRRRNR